YPRACGLGDEPPILPLSPEIKSCLLAAGKARIAYIRAYGATVTPPSAAAVPTSPPANLNPTPTRAEPSAAVPKREPTSSTKIIARAVVSDLVKRGRAPAKENVFLYISAMRRMDGETGAPLVNWYGNTVYDYGKDELSYTACSSKSWFGC